jgi:hypothetical protein
LILRAYITKGCNQKFFHRMAKISTSTENGSRNCQYM